VYTTYCTYLLKYVLSYTSTITSNQLKLTLSSAGLKQQSIALAKERVLSFVDKQTAGTIRPDNQSA